MIDENSVAKKRERMLKPAGRAVGRIYTRHPKVYSSIQVKHRPKKAFRLCDLAQACRIAAQLGDNPAFHEAHLLAAEIFDLAAKEEANGPEHRNDA